LSRIARLNLKKDLPIPMKVGRGIVEVADPSLSRPNYFGLRRTVGALTLDELSAGRDLYAESEPYYPSFS